MNSWILEFQEMTQALDGLGDFGSREPGYYYYGVWCFDHAKEILALTEQLRLANEDAERLAEYVGHKRTCTWLVTRSDVTPRCGCKLSDAMYLHKKRITQESE